MNDKPAPVPVLKPSEPTVAIAFGGGGARGLAHIHVIEALDDLGIRPVVISGSSIGSIMGAGMAAGLRGTEIREYVLATIGRRREVMNRIWSLRPTNLAAMAGGFRVGQFNLERMLKAFLPEAIPADFADLRNPLKVMVTDYYGQSERVCEAAISIRRWPHPRPCPPMFMPVRIDGRVMIDGGIYNPVPFDHLEGLADIVIGIDVVGGPEGDGETMPNRIESLFGASQLMMQSIIAMKVKAHPPDILLRPDVSRFRVMDFLKAQEVLAATAGIRDQVKVALEEAFAAKAGG